MTKIPTCALKSVSVVGLRNVAATAPGTVVAQVADEVHITVVVIGCWALDGVSHTKHGNKLMTSPAKSREKFL
jgi:hypothetical protein